MTRKRSRTISIADDDRARIPFAIIGVLLLVSSVMIVAMLQTRSEPEIDLGTDQAVDRGEAYATSEIRHATVRATDRVVQSPVTTVDSDMDSVLDPDNAFEDQTRLTILAEATAALDGREQDVGQGQTVEVTMPEVDDWTDEDDLETGIGYVDLEEEDGIMDVTIEDVEFTVRDGDGDIEAEVIRDITVSVGTTMMELHDRVEEYEAHLNKGMIESVEDREGYGYDLAKRMWPLTWGKAYYDRLLGDPADRAFENVTPNDHTEVMANDARLTAQQEVFGTQDDYGNRVMAGPFICMTFDLVEQGIDVIDRDRFDQIADDLHPDDNVSSIDELCAERLVSPDGELPEMPTIEDITMSLLGNIDKSGTIQGHPFADMAMYEMEAGLGQDDLERDMRETLNETNRFSEAYLEDYYGESERVDFDQEGDPGAVSDIQSSLESIEDNAIHSDRTTTVIDEVYTVNGDLGSVSDSPTGYALTHPPAPAPDSDEYDVANLSEMDPRYSTWTKRVDATIDKTTADHGDSSLDRTLVSVDIEVEMGYSTLGRWNNTNTNSSPNVYTSDSRTTNYTASFELDGEFAPDLEINPNNVENVLDRGGSPDPYFEDPTNWEDAADEVTVAFFGRNFDSDSELESWIRGNSGDIESYEDFRGAINYDSSFDEDIQLRPRDRGELNDEIMADLMEVHNATVTEMGSVDADVMEMLTADESPIRELSANVSEMESEYVNSNSDFDNAPAIATMEARRVYFDNIDKYIDELASEHERVTTGGDNLMNDLFGGFLDSANAIIGGPMDLLDEMLGSGEELLQDEGGADVDTPDVLNDVHIEVDGSPTYHSSQVAVNQTEVPAVRAAGDGPLDIDENMDFAPMGTGYDNKVGLPGFPLIPWPPLFYLQVDAWEIELEGEYARFEVQATSGDPSTTDKTTYIREDKDVFLETPEGGELKLGSTDPISYENSQSILVVVPAPQFLPSGAPGVGDNQHGGDAPGESCSPLWGDIGPDVEDDDPESQENDCW